MPCEHLNTRITEEVTNSGKWKYRERFCTDCAATWRQHTKTGQYEPHWQTPTNISVADDGHPEELWPGYPKEPADYVRISVIGRIVKSSDSHGICHLVEVPQLDFAQPRMMWITDDEIEG